ncbi:MAG: leucine-rich repeat domain-containing protein [Eubacteriales bacterium]|nr:leucine-rich repeat domain-containing protein [Eubacteriales bacterium]
MKKAISVLFLLIVIIVAFSLTANAEAVDVSVTADEGWAQATYDPTTTVLTNVSEGYSFKITRNDSASTAILLPNGVQTATKIVLPSAFFYNDKTYTITAMKEYIIGNSNTLTQEVIVSEGITVLGNVAGGSGYAQTFRNATGLRSITLPSTLTFISNNCFMGCTNLLSIDIPAGVTAIPSQAFSGNSLLAEITFNGNNIVSIGDSAFVNCLALTAIDLPDSVTTIGSSAFSTCSNLSDLVIPAGVSEIKGTAFYKTAMLSSLTFKGSVNTFGADVFKYSKVSNIIFEGAVAPSTFGVFGSYSGTAVTVNYPATGSGYDSAAFLAYFPAGKTTFTPVGATPSVTSATISNVSVVQGGYRVNYAITLANDVTSSSLYVALYNNDYLVAVQSVEASETTIDFTTDQTITKSKIFVWDNLVSTKPLCTYGEKLFQ